MSTSTNNVVSDPIISFAIQLPDWVENTYIANSIPNYSGTLTSLTINNFVVCLYPTLQLFLPGTSSSVISTFITTINTYFNTVYPNITALPTSENPTTFLSAYQTVFAFAYYEVTPVSSGDVTLTIGYNLPGGELPYQAPSTTAQSFTWTVTVIANQKTQIGSTSDMPYIYYTTAYGLQIGNNFSNIGTINAYLTQSASVLYQSDPVSTIYIVLTLSPTSSPTCYPVFADQQVFAERITTTSTNISSELTTNGYSFSNSINNITVQDIFTYYNSTTEPVIGIIPVTLPPPNSSKTTSAANEFCIMWVTTNA